MVRLLTLYREVYLTYLYFGSSDASFRLYTPVVGGVNNQLPIKKAIADNPIEEVCSFVLYSNSATQDDARIWTIDTDFT